MFTLSIFKEVAADCGYGSYSILDLHSRTACYLLTFFIENVRLTLAFFVQTLRSFPYKTILIPISVIGKYLEYILL